ncbi:unnamed protein product [Caretta caretta]
MHLFPTWNQQDRHCLHCRVMLAALWPWQSLNGSQAGTSGQLLQHPPFISSYIRATKVPNVKKPLAIDVSQPWDQWAGLSQGCCNVIIIINLLHFLAQGLEGLFQGVGQLLKPGGVCQIYGPFAINGIISPESNMKLEEELQER